MRLTPRLLSSVLGTILTLLLSTHTSAESSVVLVKNSAPAVDPCRLLTDSEIRKAFPDAKAGESRSQLGRTWHHLVPVGSSWRPVCCAGV